MRKLIRSPLTWLVAVEVVVVGALAVVTWNVVSSALRPSFAAPISLPLASAEPTPPLPDLPTITPPARGPLPGLNLGSGFWRTRLEQLNREQAALAQLEWRIVHSAMDAVRSYVENVVVPAIRRAEK